eukprot:CAMPEP_0196722350 /NCGR_PEP_ID=MMETSP1091-20130531/4730_1 /TAXON_ID=302021 /ORGANISM="Rhodomonas sp., Strain CCMP768" /LENGTH=168 /DNA_ID=CAMNT_0042064029 /DNA_START=616 /DNA_END=1122 /DNA_ORIENTATION=+
MVAVHVPSPPNVNQHRRGLPRKVTHHEQPWDADGIDVSKRKLQLLYERPVGVLPRRHVLIRVDVGCPSVAKLSASVHGCFHVLHLSPSLVVASLEPASDDGDVGMREVHWRLGVVVDDDDALRTFVEVMLRKLAQVDGFVTNPRNDDKTRLSNRWRNLRQLTPMTILA